MIGPPDAERGADGLRRAERLFSPFPLESRRVFGYNNAC